MQEIMTDDTAAADAAEVLHPIIEGVGVGGRCRWGSPSLCPHFHLTRVAVQELTAAGLLAQRTDGPTAPEQRPARVVASRFYDRVLTAEERQQVDACVQEKYGPTAPEPAPDFRSAIIRGLEVRFKAVLTACELAEAEARHVVDDEVYVSVGLIRNALRTPTPTAPEPAAQPSAVLSEADLADLRAVWAGWSTMPHGVIAAVERIKARATQPDPGDPDTACRCFECQSAYGLPAPGATTGDTDGGS